MEKLFYYGSSGCGKSSELLRHARKELDSGKRVLFVTSDPSCNLRELAIFNGITPNEVDYSRNFVIKVLKSIISYSNLSCINNLYYDPTEKVNFDILLIDDYNFFIKPLSIEEISDWCEKNNFEKLIITTQVRTKIIQNIKNDNSFQEVPSGIKKIPDGFQVIRL